MNIVIGTLFAQGAQRLPFTIRQEGWPGAVKFDALTRSNSAVFKAGVQKWEQHPAILPVVDYMFDHWQPYIDDYRIPESRLATPQGKIRSMIMFASTGRNIEGFTRLGITRASITTMLFMAVAPWNIRTPFQNPKFPALSGSLMMTVFSLALYFGQRKRDAQTIFAANPFTLKGREFIKRIFHLRRVPPSEAIVMVTKQGVRAYLSGDMELFCRNCGVDEDPE